MNKYDFLFGFGTEGLEKAFADGLFALLVIFLVAFALGRRRKAAKERQQERRSAAQAFGEAVKRANPSVQAAQYVFDAARAVTAVPGGQIHLSDALPSSKPPRPTGSLPAAPVYASAEGTAGSEGTEGHAPGFHGERLQAARLEKQDLGALRARQNAHTAENLNWKPPEETQLRAQKAQGGRAAFTPAQLRQAVIMKEIFDAPLSRRTRTGRTYGR